MTKSRITSNDLDWWMEFASSRTWTFARTYAATAPHDYIVQDRAPGVSHEDIERAARVICTFGTPGKYYAVTKIYLVSPDGQHRWWTEDRHFADATLVNRATTDLFYGIQNAPSTVSGTDSPYDTVATVWDAEHPIGAEEADHVTQLLSSVRGKYLPQVLDLGCGTGRVLDLGLVTADRYAAVDTSHAMLNVLVRKHPQVAAVYPANVRDLLAAGTFTPGQFDWVVLDADVDLTTFQRHQVRSIARRALITVHGDTWTINPTAPTGAPAHVGAAS